MARIRLILEVTDDEGDINFVKKVASDLADDSVSDYAGFMFGESVVGAGVHAPLLAVAVAARHLKEMRLVGDGCEFEKRFVEAAADLICHMREVANAHPACGEQDPERN